MIANKTVPYEVSYNGRTILRFFPYVSQGQTLILFGHTSVPSVSPAKHTNVSEGTYQAAYMWRTQDFGVLRRTGIHVHRVNILALNLFLLSIPKSSLRAEKYAVLAVVQLARSTERRLLNSVL